jgi:hypothetical protein
MVYFITDGTFTKIGKADDVNKRLRELQTGNPKKLSVKLCIEGDEVEEKKLHKIFHRRRMVGEWFIIDFDYDKEFIQEIIDIKFSNKIKLNNEYLKDFIRELVINKQKHSISEISKLTGISYNTVKKYYKEYIKEFTLDEYYFMINKNNSLKDEKLSLMKDAIDKLNNLGLKVNKLTVSQYSGVSRNTVNKRWKELIKYTS